jgi:large subunit ribosomal protein L17
LIENKKIKTTAVKAKHLSRFIEKLITKAKKGDLASRRLILKNIGPKATDKLMKEIGPMFTERHGGYTRIIKLNRRINDGSKMAIIEFTS